MNKKEIEKLSKHLSFLLRHRPDAFHLLLDEEGFCSLDDVTKALQSQSKWKHVTTHDILEVVRTCEKQRFEIKDNMIRARYGHSVARIAFEKHTPPPVLIHGTHEGAVSHIVKEGIKRMNRQYVHLSETDSFARLSAERRGKAVFVHVDTKKATEEGVSFYYRGGEVWLSDDIPPACLSIRKEKNNG